MRYRLRTDRAAVAVEDGRLVDAEAVDGPTVDLGPGWIVPGLINGHDHLHRNHYPRLGDPPYPDAYAWGRDLHTRWSDEIERGRAVDRTDALLFGALKNLLAGVTTVVHHDAWEAAFEHKFPIRVARVRQVHSLGFDPHPVRSGAGDPRLPLCIHLAEGTTPGDADEVRRLDELGLLDASLLAVHLVGVDDEGVERLRTAGSAMVWCPSSNHFLFGRTAPEALIASGIDVLLGSDSLLTADGTLLDEIRHARRLGILDDRRLEDAVGATAARRLGLEAPSLEPGARADLICLRRPVLDATAADVALVVVGGRPVLGDAHLAPLFEQAGVAMEPLTVQGSEKVVAAPLGTVAARIVGAWPEAGRIFDRRTDPATATAGGDRGRDPAMTAPSRPNGASGGPTVSVVVPTRDRVEWLPAAVDSVLAQTFRDLELIVVDDASTDGTVRYLDAVADPRLRVVRGAEGGGAGAARNSGIAEARGTFLAFLDSDDLWLPDKLDVQLAEIRGAGAAWSYTLYDHVDAGGNPVAARAGHWRPVSGDVALALVKAEAPVSIVTVLVERTLVEEVGGFRTDPGIREDLDFLIRLALRAPTHAVPRRLARVRDHAGRTTRRHGASEAFQISARTYDGLLPLLPEGKLKAAATRRRAELLVEAGDARPSRRALRRLIRPILGRESPAWRWIPWPPARFACFRDPVDCVIHALLASRRAVGFIQVGAHDGVIHDPLWSFRRYPNWSGVLVEPAPGPCARLRENYRPWGDRFRIEEAAVDAHPGSRGFHEFVVEDGRGDLDQLGSLSPAHLERHAPPGASVSTRTVRCVTLAELGVAHGVSVPDVVVVDAEGHDGRILDTLDLTGAAPAVILYEDVHLEPEERIASKERLEGHGYRTLGIGADTLAVCGAVLGANATLRRAWSVVTRNGPS